ncbi:MAG: chemotaxis-specific protein-glutamate methyltransferase CheB [Sulfitobacter sp.]
MDDSRSVRTWLRLILNKDPRLHVVGEAASAEEARQLIKTTNPDVITLDIEMPGMNGLEFLERLMRLKPMPVVMVSGKTKFGSEAAIAALTIGAVDCILKPGSGTDSKTFKDIARRVFSAACSTLQPFEKITKGVHNGYSPAGSGPQPIVLIGASTGGVNALETVLPTLRANGPPVVIVQHMPATFLISFSQLLNRNLSQNVSLARNGASLAAGQIVLAPEQGAHTELVRRNGVWQTYLRSNVECAAHCPSVDTLFSSAAPFGHDVIAVILTGLGRDGSIGMQLLHRSGAFTIGQDEATSVVYGMPKAAWKLGVVDKKLPLTQIGAAINQAIDQHRQQSRGGPHD